ncbi:hypothetical protein ACHAQA_005125 [Verticillium albo-atrum]
MDCDVGFIGLGAIGYPMAAAVRRHLGKQFTLYVFDVFQPAVQKFQDAYGDAGPIVFARSPRDAAASAGVVISMVPGPKEVMQVYLDAADGIVAAPEDQERILLECSTIDPQTATTVSQMLFDTKRGTYVDAPVSGGVPAAERETLSFIIGHAQPQAGSRMGERLRQIVGMMSDPQKVFWCGGVGLGLAAKISNNYISCSVLLLIAEAMAIGVKAGLDPALLHEIIHNSTGQTFMGDNVCPVPGVVAHAPSSNNWRLGFKTQMFLKDLSLGINAARQHGLEPVMGEAAYGVFETAAQNPKCIVSSCFSE